MKTSLCASCCALLILWSPAFAQDHTTELQNLIDDPEAPVDPQTLQRQVTIPNDRPAWITGPIRLPGNLRLTLAESVVIEAKPNVFIEICGPSEGNDPCDYLDPGPYGRDRFDCPDPINFPDDPNRFNKLFLAMGVDNLSIIGNTGATIRMQENEYPACSNFVHALALFVTTNVEVSGLRIESTGGDGIYIEDGLNVKVHDCTVDMANRNGISIISGTDITVENCTMKNSGPKNPQSGLDIEPFRPDHKLEGIVIKGCTAERHGVKGFNINVTYLNSSSAPVDVRFEDCTVSESRRPYGGYGFHAEEFLRADTQPPETVPGGFATGLIRFVNCSAIDPGIDYPEDPEVQGLEVHLRLDWDLRSPLRMEFTGLHLFDNANDPPPACPPFFPLPTLIWLNLLGGQLVPRPLDQIVINGTVMGTSNDTIFSISTAEHPSCGAVCQSCPECPSCGTYPEFGGCLAVGTFDEGAADALPNLSIMHATPVCGNGVVEACEECDDENQDDNDDCDNLCYFPTPDIHVQWDEGGTNQPFPDQDYEIDTAVEGTPDFPNVILRTGEKGTFCFFLIAAGC